MYDANLLAKARAIKMLICDVDGVLSSGHLYYTHEGPEQMAFHVHDGLGLNLLQSTGVKVAIITTSNSPIIAMRMKQLQIPYVYQGKTNKIQVFENLLKEHNLQESEVAYIGDDLPDLPLIKRCGLGIAVKNATPILLKSAHLTTNREGGNGAVREICDLIMFAQNTTDIAFKQFDLLL